MVFSPREKETFSARKKTFWEQGESWMKEQDVIFKFI
jgi:hypothetical protein